MVALDDFRDIFRGALASLGGFGGRMLARLTLMIVAGQLYGAGPLGVLGQVAGLIEILGAIAVLGLRRSLLDMLSAASKRGDSIERLVKQALLTSFFLAAVSSLLLGFAWPFLFPDIDMPGILYVAIPSIAFADVAGTAIRFKRVIKWEVIARCIFEPWTFLVMAVILYGLGFNETALLVAYSLSLVAAAIGILVGCYLAFDLRRLMLAPVKIKSLMVVSRKSFPVGVTDVGIMMFRRFDILILSVFASHEATGIYYMAQQIVTVPHKIHQLFEPMMSPVLAKLHHDSGKEAIRDTLKRVCRWVFSLQLALTVPFAIFGSFILGIFGNEFEAGVLVLAFLLVAELMDGSFALTETPLVFATPKIPPHSDNVDPGGGVCCNRNTDEYAGCCWRCYWVCGSNAISCGGAPLCS